MVRPTGLDFFSEVYCGLCVPLDELLQTIESEIQVIALFKSFLSFVFVSSALMLLIPQPPPP